jgi:hypothetical protein
VVFLFFSFFFLNVLTFLCIDVVYGHKTAHGLQDFNDSTGTEKDGHTVLNLAWMEKSWVGKPVYRFVF